MAGILRVDQIQSTAGSNVIDVSSGTFKIWDGNSYEAFTVSGALLSINTYTSQNGTWNSKSTSGGSGVWSKPSGCTHVLVYCTGGRLWRQLRGFGNHVETKLVRVSVGEAFVSKPRIPSVRVELGIPTKSKWETEYGAHGATVDVKRGSRYSEAPFSPVGQGQ